MTWGIAPSNVTECAKSNTNLGTISAAESGPLGASPVSEVVQTPK